MSAQEYLSAPYEKIREALDSGLITSRALVEASLQKAEQENPELNAMISFCSESALAEADAADLRLKSGERNAVLGIPVLLKDIILAKGTRTTAASKMLENFVAPYDATVTAKLKKDGAPIIGKANCDEYAMGSSNENSHFGPVKNPWNKEYVPGGSSGGSAAAVAASWVPFALGTDTGGSIRQPASLSGITGMKPTYGRVSRYGVVAFASSLDQVGPMSQDALGCAAVLESISGVDSHDATSRKKEDRAFVKGAQKYTEQASLKGLKIGVPKEFFQEGLDAEVEKISREAMGFMESEGASFVPVELAHTAYALATYYIICSSEASSNLARYDGIHYGHRSQDLTGNLDLLYSKNRGEAFGSEVQLRILLGTYSLSSGYYDAYYKKASQLRNLIKQDFLKAFEQCDLIVGPTSPIAAFKLGAKTEDPLAMYLADIYSPMANLAGIPGLSMNVGWNKEHLPVGLQILGPHWSESEILALAHYYQKNHPEKQERTPS